MTIERTPRILTLCLCCAAAAAAAALSCDSFTISFSFVTPKRAEATETRTVAMPDGANLVVDNENGSTRVTVDPDATEATLEITRTAFGEDQAEADALLEQIIVTVTEPTTDVNTLRIDAPTPDTATSSESDFQFSLIDDELNITGILGRRQVAIVRLRITLPAGHAVDVTQTNGATRVVDLDTAGTLTSENGSIRSIDATADLTVDTRNGRVDIEGHRGSLDAETRNGRLEIEVRTLAAGRHIQARTHNGRVGVELPRDIDAELSAETDNGIVLFRERDFDNVTFTTDERRRIVATLNDGGPMIDVQTDNGIVDIDGD